MINRISLRLISLLMIFSFLAGCSTRAASIKAAYVSPNLYQSFSCNQIHQEKSRLRLKIAEVTGQQDMEATKDAVALTVGLVIFWPALFLMIGEDKKDELARLKGEYEAVESMAIQKDCYNPKEDVVEEKQETDLAEKEQITPKPRVATKLSARDYNKKAMELVVDGEFSQAPKAITYLDKAIDLDPNFVMAYHNRGIAYINIKAFGHGCKDLEKACSLGSCTGLGWAKQEGHCKK